MPPKVVLVGGQRGLCSFEASPIQIWVTAATADLALRKLEAESQRLGRSLLKLGES